MFNLQNHHKPPNTPLKRRPPRRSCPSMAIISFAMGSACHLTDASLSRALKRLMKSKMESFARYLGGPVGLQLAQV